MNVMRDDTKLVAWAETFIPTPAGKFWRGTLYLPPTMTRNGRRGTRYCDHKHSSLGLALKCATEKMMPAYVQECTDRGTT